MKSEVLWSGLAVVLVVALGFYFYSTKTSPEADLYDTDATVKSASLEEESELGETNTNMETEENLSETKILDVVVGTGAEAVNGKVVSVHYTGTLADGTKFDSSVDRGEPIEFPLGTGAVIVGWEKGILGMKVGGKRKLTIPHTEAYGEMGRPPVIPGKATLLFDVELMDVK